MCVCERERERDGGLEHCYIDPYLRLDSTVSHSDSELYFVPLLLFWCDVLNRYSPRGLLALSGHPGTLTLRTDDWRLLWATAPLGRHPAAASRDWPYLDPRLRLIITLWVSAYMISGRWFMWSASTYASLPSCLHRCVLKSLSLFTQLEHPALSRDIMQQNSLFLLSELESVCFYCEKHDTKLFLKIWFQWWGFDSRALGKLESPLRSHCSVSV